jgi:hypothetical protein
MGTSQSYSGFSKKPNWKPLSDSITRACDSGKIPNEKLARVASNFVNLLGGSNSGGRGKSKIGGKSGIRTAQKLGGFFGEISSLGLSQALANTGFDYDGTQSSSDIINHLLEHCAGVASAIDDTAAKEAERQLLEEIVTEAQDFSELEKKFKEKIEEFGIEELMIKYYAYYVYEHLAIDFYEHLIKSKGKSMCGNLYKQLKDFLFEKIKNISRNRDLSKIKWNGDEGNEMVKNTFEDTLKAFEGYES